MGSGHATRIEGCDDTAEPSISAGSSHHPAASTSDGVDGVDRAHEVGDEAASTSRPTGDPCAEPLLFAEVEALILADRRVTLLQQEHRDKVLSLARSLQHRYDDEDPCALYENPGALIRYLRARKWDLVAAEDMIRATGRWRKEFGLAALRDGAFKDMLEAENATGKLYVRGRDLTGRPLLYMKPHLENSSNQAGCVAHLVYCMERAAACADRTEAEALADGTYVDDGGEGGITGKFVVLADFGSYSMSNAISLQTAREVLSIMQNHYPERLGQAFIFDPPWLFSVLWAGLSRFVDPVTAQKLQIIDEERGPDRTARLSKTFDMTTIEDSVGGENPVPFDSQIFLNVKRDDSEFGLEFDEQCFLQEQRRRPSLQQAQAARGRFFVSQPSTPSTWDPDSPAARFRRACVSNEATAFWAVSSDPRVFALSKERRALVRSLARRLHATVLDTASGPDAQAASTAVEAKGFLDDAGNLIRFLETWSWNLHKAEAAIRATAAWRLRHRQLLHPVDAQPDAATEDGAVGIAQVEATAKEAALCRLSVQGCDSKGRPVIRVQLDRCGAGGDQGFLGHLLQCVDQATKLVDENARVAAGAEPVGQIVLLVDFAGYQIRNRPTMHALMEAARMLQDHYPERLAVVYLLQPPPRVACLWPAFRCFLAPKTAAKVLVVRTQQEQADLFASLSPSENACCDNVGGPLQSVTHRLWCRPWTSGSTPLCSAAWIRTRRLFSQAGRAQPPSSAVAARGATRLR